MATEAYEVLIREHERMVFAYALEIVGERALAEDVVQEAFVRGYEQLRSLRDKGAFAPWIRAIARNLALDALRAAGRETTMAPEVIEGMEDVLRRFDDAERGDTWGERLTVVRRCFDRLPEALKTCSGLFYFEGKRAKEIAVSLEVQFDAVRKRLERARAVIRDCVEKSLGLGGV
jgi:RNA polymerase sigma factor (sigma-70 family)